MRVNDPSARVYGGLRGAGPRQHHAGGHLGQRGGIAPEVVDVVRAGQRAGKRGRGDGGRPPVEPRSGDDGPPVGAAGMSRLVADLEGDDAVAGERLWAARAHGWRCRGSVMRLRSRMQLAHARRRTSARAWRCHEWVHRERPLGHRRRRRIPERVVGRIAADPEDARPSPRTGTKDRARSSSDISAAHCGSAKYSVESPGTTAGPAQSRGGRDAHLRRRHGQRPAAAWCAEPSPAAGTPVPAPQAVAKTGHAASCRPAGSAPAGYGSALRRRPWLAVHVTTIPPRRGAEPRRNRV